MLNQETHIQRIILRGLIISQSQSKSKPVFDYEQWERETVLLPFRMWLPIQSFKN